MNIQEKLQDLITYALRGGIYWQSKTENDFSFMSGDPNDYCAYENGVYSLHKEERGVHSPTIIATSNLEDVEKFLSFRYGPDVRLRATSFPRLSLNPKQFQLDSTVDGYSITGTPAEVEVTWERNNEVHLISKVDDFDVARFLVYEKFTAEEIRLSFLNPTGHPVFTASETAGP